MSTSLDLEIDHYWRTVISTIRDGIMIVDTSGVIASVNEAFERMTGYGRESLIGKTCEVMRCDLCDRVLEHEGAHWCSLFRNGIVDERRCIIRRKDGSPMHALKNAALLQDGEGHVLGAVETIADISELVEKDNQIAAYREELHRQDGFHGILGRSAAMQRVFEVIEDAADSEAPVIVIGESGTGKELVSRAIHEIGARRDAPFVKVNCASLSESLLESELFGHVRGAFTGAYRDRVGRFEQADGGDLFLDEVADLPMTTQVKLLRVLEEKTIERVGDSTPISARARIICATNRDLKRMVEEKTFREDLFFRINVIPIYLPPLRERREDIPQLASAFFNKLRLRGPKAIEGVSRAAMDLLLAHPWPGNVRELRSAFEYAFVTCHDSLIQPHHFPQGLQGKAPPPSTRSAMNLKEMERQELIDALERTGGNQTQAARILGVSRVTVWNRMRRYGIRADRHLQVS